MCKDQLFVPFSSVKNTVKNIRGLLSAHGPGSVIGIAIGYGMDGQGIEYLWGRDFQHLCRPALGPTQPPVQWVPGFSRG